MRNPGGAGLLLVIPGSNDTGWGFAMVLIVSIKLAVEGTYKVLLCFDGEVGGSEDSVLCYISLVMLLVG